MKIEPTSQEVGSFFVVKFKKRLDFIYKSEYNNIYYIMK
jgi:hypothetical protein